MSRSLKASLAVSMAFLLACNFTAPITPPRLGQPAITKLFLSEARFGTYHEAVHIEWVPPAGDSITARSYTILRKADGDSLFDVFTGSRGVPDSITSFDDNISLLGFPLDGYSLIKYRIMAVDTLGRSSDTSAACSLFLAPQPELTTLDTSKWCFEWLSKRIQGSVTSHIKVWNSSGDFLWTSQSREEFGSENNPVRFSACLPDSPGGPKPDLWYFAVFLYANGSLHQSMTVGSFNVP